MSSAVARRRPSDTSIVVKYTACANTENSDEELDNISILERDNNGSDIIVDDENNHSVPVTANGPRHIQGPGGSTPPTDRTKLIGERLSAGDRISLSSPIYSTKVVEQASSSRQSLIDIFNSKLDRVKTKKRSRADSIFWKKPKLIGLGEDVTTSREVRKLRKKDIAERFGKKAHRQAVKQQQDWFETSTTRSEKEGCNWTFVFDPAGRLGHWWSGIVSVAFLYNFWIIIYRFAFHEINSDNIGLWFALDYSADFLYVLDIAFHFRTGFLEDGVLQTDPVKLRIHYMNTTTFYIDCLCLLPLDFLYLSIGFYSILRFFRLVKVYRFWSFLDRTERHTNYPNVIRTLTLMHYLLALFHWNACFYYIVATKLGKSSETWRFPKDDGDVLKQYLHGLYWSTLTLTTIGDPPTPRTTGDYFFTIFEMLFGLLLFATVLGHIANIVASVSAARKDFQGR